MLLRRILQVVSWLALAGTVVPSCLFVANSWELDSVKTAMLVATVVWFMATPLWMHRKPDEAAQTS
jgi:hypothetical protein